MRKYLRYFVLVALVALVALAGALEVIRSSAGRDYDRYQVGERKTQTWLEILEEGDEAHKNQAVDDLLSRLEDSTEDYLESRSVLMILGWADLAPAQARPVAARLTELLETDYDDPSMVVWTLGRLGPEAETALPRLEELAASALPAPDADDPGWEDAREYARSVRDEAALSILRIREAREKPTAPESAGWTVWHFRLILLFLPALAVPLVFFFVVRGHTGDREHAARARFRWLTSVDVVIWICRVALLASLFEKSGQPPWPWPLLGVGLLTAMLLMAFAVNLSAQILEQRLRDLGGSPWKNMLPWFYLGVLQSSHLLVAFSFVPLGMFFVDGAGEAQVGWVVLATFFLVEGIVVFYGPRILQAILPIEVPPNEKLTRVLERHSGQYRGSSMLRAFDSSFVNAFVTIPGRRIVVSDAMVAELTEPELDGIMCHELGHLQNTSETISRLTYLVGICTLICLGMALGPWLVSWRGPIRPIHELLPAGFVAAYVVALFSLPRLVLRFSRRWETRADRFAVETCTDPAALASGLVKLHELNWLPMQFDADGRERQTHPSLKKRLEEIYAHPRLAGASNPWARRDARRTLKLNVQPGQLAICRLNPSDPVPGWSERGLFHAVTRTPDELSIVCSDDAVPDGVRCERGWSCLAVRGPLEFTEVGILSSLTAPLAEAGISAFALSTYDTDYIMVRSADRERALAALKAAGHTIEE